jgi:hypothetical protein
MMGESNWPSNISNPFEDAFESSSNCRGATAALFTNVNTAFSHDNLRRVKRKRHVSEKVHNQLYVFMSRMACHVHPE